MSARVRIRHANVLVELSSEQACRQVIEALNDYHALHAIDILSSDGPPLSSEIAAAQATVWPEPE